MVWLWAVTAFSAVAATATAIGWAVTAAKLSNLRWKVYQDSIASKHAGAFGDHHRCIIHDSQGIHPTDARARDLTEIRLRYEEQLKNRTD